MKHMHPLTWAYKWFQHDADFKFHNKGIVQDMRAKESVSLIVWMDKKYRTEDKKEYSLLTAFQTFRNLQTNSKRKIFEMVSINTRGSLYQAHQVKAYNNRIGVDRHDRLVGHHSIPLSSKRGYVKVFFHLLDSIQQGSIFLSIFVLF